MKNKNNFFLLVFMRIFNLFIRDYFIIITRTEFFTPTLASGLPLEWQQVSWSFQDSSQYSGRSSECWIVWMVSTCPLMSMSSSLLTSAPITIGITVNLMFYIFLILWQGLSTYFSFSLSFIFTLQSVGTAKFTIRQVLFLFLFFLLSITSSGRLAGITIIYSFEFFTSVLADGLSLEFEWQQVSSSLQDSSQYSGRSQ